MKAALLMLLLWAVAVRADDLDQAVGLSRSPDVSVRRASVLILGKSASLEATDALVRAMYDPDGTVRDAAAVSFWEQARPCPPGLAEQLLGTAALPDEALQQKVAENLPLIAALLSQRPRPPGGFTGAFTVLRPEETRMMQALYRTQNPRILRPLLANYFYLNVPVSREMVLGWVGSDDEDLSIRALSIASAQAPWSQIEPALSARWARSSESWQWACAQLPGYIPGYAEWLGGRAPASELVREMILVTTRLGPGRTSVAAFEQIRPQLTRRETVQRWVNLLPTLGQGGRPLAEHELRTRGLGVPDVVQIWPIYGVPLPAAIAAGLAEDPRRQVRQFAFGSIHAASPAQARLWAQSEWPDVRARAVAWVSRSELEDTLLDDSAEVRLATIQRTLHEFPSDSARVLAYGLDDGALCDQVLSDAVSVPALAPLLETWANTPERRDKLQNAKNLFQARLASRPFWAVPVRKP